MRVLINCNSIPFFLDNSYKICEELMFVNAVVRPTFDNARRFSIGFTLGEYASQSKNHNRMIYESFEICFRCMY